MISLTTFSTYEINLLNSLLQRTRKDYSYYAIFIRFQILQFYFILFSLLFNLTVLWYLVFCANNRRMKDLL